MIQASNPLPTTFCSPPTRQQLHQAALSADQAVQLRVEVMVDRSQALSETLPPVFGTVATLTLGPRDPNKCVVRCY